MASAYNRIKLINEERNRPLDERGSRPGNSDALIAYFTKASLRELYKAMPVVELIRSMQPTSEDGENSIKSDAISKCRMCEVLCPRRESKQSRLTSKHTFDQMDNVL